MTFFDSQNMQVGSVDTRAAEAFTENQDRDFVIPSLKNIFKAVLVISSIPFSIIRAGEVTFVNSAELIQVAPAHTPRYGHDFVTLAPKGFSSRRLALIEFRMCFLDNRKLYENNIYDDNAVFRHRQQRDTTDR